MTELQQSSSSLNDRHLYIPRSLDVLLGKAAENHHVSKGEIVRTALREHLADAAEHAIHDEREKTTETMVLQPVTITSEMRASTRHVAHENNLSMNEIILGALRVHLGNASNSSVSGMEVI